MSAANYKGGLREKIQRFSVPILAGFAFIAILLVGASIVEGTKVVSEKVLPFLTVASIFATVFCITFLFPLSFFLATRVASVWGFLIISYLFGLGAWTQGFLVTFDIWGGKGVLFGLIFGGIGVVPLGILASSLNGLWFVAGDLFLRITLTYAARGFAFYLAAMIDRAPEKAAVARMQKAAGSGFKVISFFWKTPVVAGATIVCILGSNQVGWSGADLLLNSSLIGGFKQEVRWFFFLVVSAVSWATLWGIYRLARPALWLVAPLAAYSALVLGVWNGIASDFDVTRVEAIRHGSANAYALQHMTLRGLHKSCKDQRIELSEDGRAYCAQALNVVVPASKEQPGSPVKSDNDPAIPLGLVGLAPFNAASPSKPVSDPPLTLQGVPANTAETSTAPPLATGSGATPNGGPLAPLPPIPANGDIFTPALMAPTTTETFTAQPTGAPGSTGTGFFSEFVPQTSPDPTQAAIPTTAAATGFFSEFVPTNIGTKAPALGSTATPAMTAETVFVKYRGQLNLAPFKCEAVTRSSFVRRVCYDAPNSYMLINLNGTWYHYCEIDSGTVSDLMAAESMGRFYNSSIKHNFDCRTHRVPQY